MPNITGNLAAGVTEPVRVTQVEEQLNGLEVNAEDLAKMVDAIEARLRSVTAPMRERNQKPDPQSIPRPVLVPLAARIESTADKFRASIDRMRELCANIELTE